MAGNNKTRMKSGKLLLYGGAAILLGALAALVVAGSASADVYSGSGPWSVFNDTTYSGGTLTVSGDIDLYAKLTLTNTNIHFAVADAQFNIHGPAGSLLMNNGAGTSTVDTNNAANYFSFYIDWNAGTVKIENVTFDRVTNGLQVNGGTATSRYFAHVTVNHAQYYGFLVSDSDATLFKISVSLDMAATLTRSDSWTNYSYDYGSYLYNQSYHYIYRYWTAAGTGVQMNGGSPWVDGVEVHVPDVSQRVDITLLGGLDLFYKYYQSYGCGPKNYYDLTYTYDYLYPSVDVYGFRSVDSVFAKFEDVRPPTENFSLDLHYTLGGNYAQSFYYCNVIATQTYNYPDNVYFLNGVYMYTANYIGVYVENGGLTSLDQLNYAMGATGISLTNDWQPSQQFYLDYFNMYYSSVAPPQVYALWSIETLSTSTMAAITNTDFSLTNSFFSGAGVRVDRNFYYDTSAAPGGAADTIFRGTVLVDRVTVVRSGATAVDIRINSEASQTFNTFDYRALVTNSTISGARAVSLRMPNHYYLNSNYTADVEFRDNDFSGGRVNPGADFGGIVTVTPCYGDDQYSYCHPSDYSTDWYKMDVLFDNNTFSDMRGPLLGVQYSDYKFPGGSSLTVTNSTLDDVSYYFTINNQGAKSPGTRFDALIKTTVDSVTFTHNSVARLSFVYGMLGGAQGSDPQNPYYDYSYCAREDYPEYGCSWPHKKPTITVTDNTFESTSMDGTGSPEASFVLAAGRGLVTFERNVVNDSTAIWVHSYLYYYSEMRFPVEDLDVTVKDNMVTNQSQSPVVKYSDPYKSGQPLRMIHNTYADSTAPFFDWALGWYSTIGGGEQNDNGATVIVTNNTFRDLSLGQDAALHLTGKITLTGNSWERVDGWAVIAEKMLKIPTIDGNTIISATNGYWFSPAVSSGLVPTATFTGLSIQVSGTGIRMENGNLILVRMDFGDATAAVDMKNGYAEVYSSKIRVLSGRVAGDASIQVYNEVGYELRWANAKGEDSGVVIVDALVVTSTVDDQILSSGRTNAVGRIPAKNLEVWSMVSYGAVTVSTLELPLKILAVFGGITQVIQLPELGPGQSPEFFEDYAAYPIMLIDPIIPQLSVGSPLPGSVVGSSTFDVLGYTFERGSGVAMQRIRVDSGPWVNIPLGSSTWSVGLTGVTEGPHTLFVEAADIATNVYENSVPFSVDVTPPTLTVSSPLEASVLTNQPVFDIRGHVEPIDGDVALNGITIHPNSRGDFFYNFTLADGLNILRFTALDKARNTVVVVRAITFDRYAPFLQVDAPVNGMLTNLVNVDVLGRTERDARVTVNGLPAFVNPIDGTFALQQVELDDLFDQTENLLVIRASDLAGNVRYENRTVLVDVKAPSIDLDLDAGPRGKIEAGLPVAATTLNVKGTTDSSDAIITIAGQPVSLNGRSFSRVLVLREGLNVIVVTSQDDAGNHRELTLRVVRDTVKPVLTLETPAEPSLLTNQTTLLVTGYTDTEGSVVSVVYTDARGIITSDPVPTTAVGLPIRYRFEYTLVLNADGNEHLVDVRAADLAGNLDTATFAYTAKVNAPFLEIIGFKTRVSDTYIWINGTTEAGINKVTINGQDFEIANQFFAVRWSLPIQSGNYSFTVSVRDEAGNQNTYTNRTDVQATLPTEGPQQSTPFWANPMFQIGAGALLFGASIAVLMMALSRRRQTD